MAKPAIDDETIRSIEAMVMAAGDFVEPSRELRPQTLNEAKSLCRMQRVANHTAIATSLALALWCLYAFSSKYIEQVRDRLSGPFPSEIEATAQSYTEQRHYPIDWGVVDAFTESRTPDGRTSSGRTGSGRAIALPHASTQAHESVSESNFLID